MASGYFQDTMNTFAEGCACDLTTYNIAETKPPTVTCNTTSSKAENILKSHTESSNLSSHWENNPNYPTKIEINFQKYYRIEWTKASFTENKNRTEILPKVLYYPILGKSATERLNHKKALDESIHIYTTANTVGKYEGTESLSRDSNKSNLAPCQINNANTFEPVTHEHATATGANDLDSLTESSQSSQIAKNTNDIIPSREANIPFGRKNELKKTKKDSGKDDLSLSDSRIDATLQNELNNDVGTATGENQLNVTKEQSSVAEETNKQTLSEVTSSTSSKGETLGSTTTSNNGFQQEAFESAEEEASGKEKTQNSEYNHKYSPVLNSLPSPTNGYFGNSKGISNQDETVNHIENGDRKKSLQDKYEDTADIVKFSGDTEHVEKKRIKITLAVGKSAGEFTVPSQTFMENLQSLVEVEDIDLEFEELTPQPYNPTKRKQWHEQLETVKYVLLLCLNQSRLGTDIDAVIEKFKGHQKKIILVVFHHVPEQQVKKITPSCEILGRHAEGKRIVLQVDYAFWKKVGHQCILNDSAQDKICSHLKNVSEEQKLSEIENL